MGVEGCGSCVKVFMFIGNFLFWLVGCVALGIGIWVFVDPDISKTLGSISSDANTTAVIETYSKNLHSAGIALMVVGGLILIIGFLGCCGAIRESQALLGAYAVILFILLGALVGTGIYFIVQRSALYEQFSTAVGKLLTEDVRKVNLAAAGNKAKTAKSTYLLGALQDMQAEGCTAALTTFIKNNISIVGYAAIGIGAGLLIAIIAAIVLCCAIRD